MARHRKTDEVELMKAAEALLLEKGYEGFHFKGLSDRLNVARSTIYEYYRNKDELITDSMKQLMDTILEKCYALKKYADPIDKLKGLLKVFLEYSHIHSILEAIPMISNSTTELVAANLKTLHEQHDELFKFIIKLIDEAKVYGKIRKDIPSIVTAGIFFHTITIPNMSKMNVDEWTDFLFDVLLKGIENREV